MPSGRPKTQMNYQSAAKVIVNSPSIGFYMESSTAPKPAVWPLMDETMLPAHCPISAKDSPLLPAQK